MIPPFDRHGKLAPGIHWATWAEIVVRFGRNAHRRELLNGLRRAIDELADAGCTVIYLDGSFVTSVPKPNDFDACLERPGVVAHRMDATIMAYAGDRSDQKAKYGGELFPAGALADPYGTPFLEFFQLDRHTRRRKGIVAIQIGERS